MADCLERPQSLARGRGQRVPLSPTARLDSVPHRRRSGFNRARRHSSATRHAATHCSSTHLHVLGCHVTTQRSTQCVPRWRGTHQLSALADQPRGKVVCYLYVLVGIRCRLRDCDASQAGPPMYSRPAAMTLNFVLLLTAEDSSQIQMTWATTCSIHADSVNGVS